MAAASSHTHKYSNVSNQDSDLSQEPIYQNQAELRSQLQKLDKGVEPIYQNLPLIFDEIFFETQNFRKFSYTTPKLYIIHLF